MPTVDDMKNVRSDIDFFDKLLGRAEKITDRHPGSDEQEFVQSQIKLYARRGDAHYLSDQEFERLNAIANGAVKFKMKPQPKPRKSVKKAKKKTAVKKKVRA